jgi:hypothetical protein
VTFNPYFYHSEQRDEGSNSDEDCDGVSVGGGFLTICCKMGHRVMFVVPVGDALKPRPVDRFTNLFNLFIN